MCVVKHTHNTHAHETVSQARRQPPRNKRTAIFQQMQQQYGDSMSTVSSHIMPRAFIANLEGDITLVDGAHVKISRRYAT